MSSQKFCDTGDMTGTRFPAYFLRKKKMCCSLLLSTISLLHFHDHMKKEKNSRGATGVTFLDTLYRRKIVIDTNKKFTKVPHFNEKFII